MRSCVDSHEYSLDQWDEVRFTKVVHRSTVEGSIYPWGVCGDALNPNVHFIDAILHSEGSPELNSQTRSQAALQRAIRSRPWAVGLPDNIQAQDKVAPFVQCDAAHSCREYFQF